MPFKDLLPGILEAVFVLSLILAYDLSLTSENKFFFFAGKSLLGTAITFLAIEGTNNFSLSPFLATIALACAVALFYLLIRDLEYLVRHP